MRTSGRARIAEYAYRTTMETIDADYPRLRRLFARHGLNLRPASAVDGSRISRQADRTEEAVPVRLRAQLETLERDLARIEAFARR